VNGRLCEPGRREDTSHKLDLNFGGWFRRTVVHIAQCNKMKASVPYVTKDFFVCSCTLKYWIIHRLPTAFADYGTLCWIFKLIVFSTHFFHSFIGYHMLRINESNQPRSRKIKTRSIQSVKKEQVREARDDDIHYYVILSHPVPTDWSSWAWLIKVYPQSQIFLRCVHLGIYGRFDHFYHVWTGCVLACAVHVNSMKT